jgi:hypothetical protein
MTGGNTPSELKTWSRATVFAILVLLALAVWPLSASAQISLDVVIGTAPPPARVEVVPAPRPGYVWAPGYWSWDGHRHVWSKGHWEAEHGDQHFVAAKWVHTPGGWRLVPAHWEHADHGREAFCPPGQAKKGRC